MQARLALEHGRRVFLLESLLVDDWARTYAGRPNTTVVRSVEDVLGHLEPALAADQDLVWA
jgi:DNA processing protein